MTQKHVLNLSRMQIGKLSENSLWLALEKKKASTPWLKKVLFESKDRKILYLAIEHFVRKAKNGDVRAKLFLNRLALERFNKNDLLRDCVLLKLEENTQMGDRFALRALLVGVRDSVPYNRAMALTGLKNLAARNEKRVLPGLIFGLKDTNLDNRRYALSGLEFLAEEKNEDAIKVLKKLASEGNKRAKDILERLRE
jgi:hypothetical protein